MKKLLSILLVLALALGLCACGDEAQPAQAAGSGGTETAADAQEGAGTSGEAAPAEKAEAEEAEPEKVYVKTERELLVKKELSGGGIPLNSKPFVGRSLDTITDYSYDEFGNLQSETVSYVWDEDAHDYGDTKNTYNENGELESFEWFAPSSLGVKLRDYYEFSSEGFCVFWSEEYEGIGKTETNYEYDDEGKLSFVSIRVNDGEPQTMTPVYENGVQVATKHVAPDGGEVEQHFCYDDEGRLISIEYDAAEPHLTNYLYTMDGIHGECRYNEYKAGDKHVVITLSYSRNEIVDKDLVSEALWTVDGNTIARVSYSYPQNKDDENTIGFTFDDNSPGPFFWGGWLSSTNWLSSDVYTTQKGNISLEDNYEMMVLGDNPYYVKSFIDYDYETFNIKVEADPSAVTEARPVEDYYPKLNDSYGGYPVPVPDGSQQLIRLTRKSNSSSELLFNTDFLYGEDGSLVGATCCFDTVASYDYMKQFFGWDENQCLVEADELGRISKMTFNPGTNSERTTEFTYPDENLMQTAYHSKSVYGETVYENDYTIDSFDVPGEIRKTQSELAPNSEIEYNEDGLVTKAVWQNRKDADGNPITDEYTYSYKADDDGFLKWVYGAGHFSFNDNGYLAEYSLMPAGYSYYEYKYAPVD